MYLLCSYFGMSLFSVLCCVLVCVRYVCMYCCISLCVYLVSEFFSYVCRSLFMSFRYPFRFGRAVCRSLVLYVVM